MNIFTLTDDENISDKINLDDLYDKKREVDHSKMVLYNKILNRIHTKIKMTSRNSKDAFCWYVIPEMMIGISRYDVKECTGYILNKLHENGFQIRYTHPNLIFISWQHYVPNYVRQELKKKTGIQVDQFGNEITEENSNNEPKDVNSLMIKNVSSSSSNKNEKTKKEFNEINNYKPIGIYNKDLFKKLEDKFN